MIIATASWFRSELLGSYSVGASAKSTNSVVWNRLKIPDTAQDVTFAIDFWECELDFEISESDFRAWCTGNDWTIKPLKDVVCYSKPALGHPVSGRGLLVSNGFRFYFPDGDGLYDFARGRVNLRGRRFR